MDRDDIAKILGLDARAGAHHPDGGRRRLRRQARSFGTAVRRPRGVAPQTSGAHGLLANGIDCEHDEAPSGRYSRQDRRVPRWPAHGHGFFRRLQHRRLCVMGPDRRQSRTRPCLRPVPHAALSCATRALSTPTSCRPAPFAASACRKARSRRSSFSTNLRSSSASIRWSFASATRSRRATQR